MTFIIFVALIGLAISGGTWLAYQVMLNFHPRPARVKSEIVKLMASFDKMVPDLVPINQKELELISHSHNQQEFRKGINKSAKGVIISIYEEPMILYAYRRYYGKNENAVLFARTSNQDIMYRIRNQQVQVYLNDQAIGIIERDGVLYSPGNYKPLSRIDKKSNLESFPVFVESKEVASIAKKDPSLNVHQRALQFVSGMDNRAEVILLVMLIWELTRAGFPAEFR